MKIKVMLSVLLLFFVAVPQIIKAADINPEILTASKDDPELRNLQWNRYVSENFVILSIDENQGEWLSKNVNKIFSWCSKRWGLEVSGLKEECRIFCVPSKKLLKKLFNLDDSKAEVRLNEDGSVKINVIWICLESKDDNFVLPYASHIVFSNPSFPIWFSRGAQVLSLPSNVVSSLVRSEDTSNFMSCKQIFALSRDSYAALSPEKKRTVDNQCALLCLMLRNELGQVKLLSFLGSLEKNDVESSLILSYGYKGLNEFESKYKMYCIDFYKEITLNKVPSSYYYVKPFLGGK